jgi:hypothetical protein
MTTTRRPIPTPDERSAPFFAAAREGQLLIKRCSACGAWLAPQIEVCPGCLSEKLGWAGASGRGKVHSFVVMHQVLHPAFREEVPYNVAIIELEEGPRLTSNVVGIADGELRVGMAVEAVFEQLSDDVFVPKFGPV